MAGGAAESARGGGRRRAVHIAEKNHNKMK